MSGTNLLPMDDSSDDGGGVRGRAPSADDVLVVADTVPSGVFSLGSAAPAALPVGARASMMVREGDDDERAAQQDEAAGSNESDDKGFEGADLATVQPLRFLLAFMGVGITRSPIYRFVYTPFIFLCVTIHSVLLGILFYADSKFAPSMIAGCFIISLNSISGLWVVRNLVRRKQLKKTATIIMKFEATRGKTVRGITRWYAFGFVIITGVLSVVWVVIVWAAASHRIDDDARIRTFLILVCIFAPFGVGAFLLALAHLALLSQLHRLQLQMFTRNILSHRYSLRYALWVHNTISENVYRSVKVMQLWLLPLLITFPLSILLQLWGVFQEQQENQFNGIYYVLLFVLVLVVVIFSMSTVSANANRIRRKVSRLYAKNFRARSEIDTLLLYLTHAGPQWSVAGAPITPGVTAIILFSACGAIGLFIRQLTIAEVLGGIDAVIGSQ